MRDVRRKCEKPTGKLATLLALSERIWRQKRDVSTVTEISPSGVIENSPPGYGLGSCFERSPALSFSFSR